MRKITTHWDGHGLNEAIEIVALDDAEGTACHNYRFEIAHHDDLGIIRRPVGKLSFQHGPRHEIDSESGVTTAAVLAMLIDHLQGFQRGPFPSRETAIVITKLEECLLWTRYRADQRAARGVLGKNEK